MTCEQNRVRIGAWLPLQPPLNPMRPTPNAGKTKQQPRCRRAAAYVKRIRLFGPDLGCGLAYCALTDDGHTIFGVEFQNPSRAVLPSILHLNGFFRRVRGSLIQVSLL